MTLREPCGISSLFSMAPTVPTSPSSLGFQQHGGDASWWSMYSTAMASRRAVAPSTLPQSLLEGEGRGGGAAAADVRWAQRRSAADGRWSAGSTGV